MVNLAQRNIRNGKKRFANASDYLETWADSDSITTINVQKDLRHPAKWKHNHLTSQYQGSEINYEHTEDSRNLTQAYKHQSYRTTN